MKATKRFSTTKIVAYTQSNAIVTVSFDTLQEAIDHVIRENELHPRSKKVNNYITDKNQKKSEVATNYETKPNKPTNNQQRDPQ